MTIFRTYLAFHLLLLYVAANAQSKEFEGRIVYETSIESKLPEVENKIWHTLLALGDVRTTYVKQGNYKLVCGLSDQYMIHDQQKVFIKFRSLDTLYYMDYSADTSIVLRVSKTGEGKTVSGYPCSPITITTSGGEQKYYYAPALYLNPEYDKNNTIGHLNVLTRETSSIWLESTEETKSYIVTSTCIQLLPETVNNSVFGLPALPLKKLVIEELMQPAVFKRAGGWLKYLTANLDVSQGARYIKIPKGEKEASQTAMVRFMVNERGMVMNAEVINRKEVHSKLAEEAIRVVSGSPPWTAATIYGEKTVFWQTQPVTFQASK